MTNKEALQKLASGDVATLQSLTPLPNVLAYYQGRGERIEWNEQTTPYLLQFLPYGAQSYLEDKEIEWARHEKYWKENSHKHPDIKWLQRSKPDKT